MKIVVGELDIAYLLGILAIKASLKRRSCVEISVRTKCDVEVIVKLIPTPPFCRQQPNNSNKSKPSSSFIQCCLSKVIKSPISVAWRPPGNII